MNVVTLKKRTLKTELQKIVQNDDDENNLYRLFKAILNVDSAYIYKEDTSTNRLERVFAYELYHQWSLLIKKYNSQHRDERYFLNAETTKHMGHWEINPKKENSFPDMIQHKSVDRPLGQAVVCEIKRKDNFSDNGFSEDIKKLKKFVCGIQDEYNFKYGVFILVGSKMIDIIKKIQSLKWIARGRNERMKDIFLVAYDGEVLQITTLYDALNKDERSKYINKLNNETQS